MKPCAAADGACSADPRRVKGYCRKHYKRWLYHGDPTVVLPKFRGGKPPGRINHVPPTVCDVNDAECTVGSKIVKGYCRKHYRRWLRHGDATRVAQPTGGKPPVNIARTVCDVNDAECTPNSLISKGLCVKHYNRWRRHGDTTTVLAPKAGSYPGGTNPARTPDNVVEQWRKLRRRGWKASEIAREYGVCRDTVYRRTTDQKAAA